MVQVHWQSNITCDVYSPRCTICLIMYLLCWISFIVWSSEPFSLVSVVLLRCASLLVLLMLCGCRHEDGTVRFWDVSSSCMPHLYTLSTSHIFGEETVSSFEVASNLDTDYEWPPFRRVRTVIITVQCALGSDLYIICICWWALQTHRALWISY